MSITRIVFDMGDVLLPLNKPKMFAAFAALRESKEVKEVERIIATDEAQAVWDKFDHNMSPTDFRTNIRRILKIRAEVPDEKIDAAWNELLDPITPKTIQFLKQLKASKKYEIVLLSNSNPIHFEQVVKLYEKDFSECFHRQCYSHHMNKAKPQADAYLEALDDSKTQEAIFFDDKEKNITAARKVGMHAVQVPKGADITTMVHESIAAVAKAEAQRQKQQASWVRIGLFGAFVAAAAGVTAAICGASASASNVTLKK